MEKTESNKANKTSEELHKTLKHKLISIDIKVLGSIDKKTEDYKNEIENKKKKYEEYIFKIILSLQKNYLRLKDLAEKENKDNNNVSTNKVKDELKALEQTILGFSEAIKTLEATPLTSLLLLNSQSTDFKLELTQQGNTNEKSNSKTNDGEKDFLTTLLNNTETLPAHLLLKNHCPECKSKLKWKDRNSSYNYTKHCINDGCNENYKYVCEPCEILFCTKCAYPIILKQCGCGNQMEYLEKISYHNCDLCTQSISSDVPLWRCDSCDFDICIKCFEKLTEESENNIE